MDFTSRNFGFLADHDPFLATCAARAEVYVFEDPNTSLIKSRQFTEYLARHVAARHGYDTEQMEFGDVLRLLSSNRLVPREIRDLFDVVRLRGNEAAHENRGDRQTALASLITEHKLAVWFHKTFADENFAPGPFRPPIAPEHANAELREELDSLRNELARYEVALAQSAGRAAEFEQTVQRLEAEARAYAAERGSLVQTASNVSVEKAVVEEELARVREKARHAAPAELQSYINRSQEALWRLGSRRAPNAAVLPLTRLRLRLQRHSRCHNAPLLLAQFSSGGAVLGYCAHCRRNSTVKFDEVADLDLWIACPNCSGRRADLAIVKSNYGFQCDSCGWSCLVSSLVPSKEELFK